MVLNPCSFSWSSLVFSSQKSLKVGKKIREGDKLEGTYWFQDKIFANVVTTNFGPPPQKITRSIFCSFSWGHFSFFFAGKLTKVQLGGHFGPERKYLAPQPPSSPTSPQTPSRPLGPSRPSPPPPSFWDFQ